MSGWYMRPILLGVLVICLFHLPNSSVARVTTNSESCSSPETPNAWIGEAPYCYANATFCDQFALDYECNSTKGGNGEECLNGTKVLCLYPSPEPLPPPTPVTMLKVLAYNVWELRYLFAQSGQRERTCRIPAEIFALHPDLDVFVFNEVFMGGCFVNDSLTLRDIMEAHGFVHYTATVGEPGTITKPENGGVFIASRWPIKYEEQLVYKNAQRGTADFLSGKGCMYAQIEKTVGSDNKVYHIFGTHLQAQNGSSIDEVRVAQAGEMQAFMVEQNIPSDEPVIYAGDLNADKINNPEHAQDVLMALKSNLPEIVGDLEATYDSDINTVFFDNYETYQWLDYVLYSADHEAPTKSTLEVLHPTYSEFFDVCMAAVNPRHTYPDSELCFISKSINDLSDHFPVLGVFDYSEEPTSAGQRSSVFSSILIVMMYFFVNLLRMTF